MIIIFYDLCTSCSFVHALPLFPLVIFLLLASQGHDIYHSQHHQIEIQFETRGGQTYLPFSHLCECKYTHSNPYPISLQVECLLLFNTLYLWCTSQIVWCSPVYLFFYPHIFALGDFDKCLTVKVEGFFLPVQTQWLIAYQESTTLKHVNCSFVLCAGVLLRKVCHCCFLISNQPICNILRCWMIIFQTKR